ncbi:SulP family inorganic anion transporter [Litorivicinus lipolyticus]|uniref:SulP family inorganic anion transporter n=1 Tax=Litorivicinus lipolyticus TaxID=418701 RepID=UPI003B594B67
MMWWSSYTRDKARDDGLAAVIVTVMLIPQSLAYALLAGLPPQIGLYASIFPLIGYALLGSSMTLAVGPVAVVSLMTAAAVGQVAQVGTPEYIGAAVLLALMSGLFLLALGLVRAGFIANLLSHPVISGFISASAVLIAISQLKHLFGIEASGHSLLELGADLIANLGNTNATSLLIGLGCVAFLFWSRSKLAALLVGWGVGEGNAALVTKMAPMLAVIATTLAAWAFNLGIKVVGVVPAGLPLPSIPDIDLGLARDLIGPAILISLVGFVESVSVGHTLAAKRREKINPTRELMGLGLANMASGVGGGFPVTGGFSRSVVNFDAGARTPMAGVITALLIALTALFLTPLFTFLPKAVLGATVIVAVLSLVDIGAMVHVFKYSRADFVALALTVIAVLTVGVEAGILVGIGCSILVLLAKVSKPHIAEVGQIEGTEHYRNVSRHPVICGAETVAIRFDERLHFLNAHRLEETVADLLSRPGLKHLILNCSAINDVDASGLDVLEAINARLKDADISFNLSEVKGPVMDKLTKSHLIEELHGRVFLSHHDASSSLA